MVNTILVIILIALLTYNLVSDNSFVSPLTIFLGVLLLIRGISGIKSERKGIGLLLVIISLYVLFVSIQDYFG